MAGGLTLYAASVYTLGSVTCLHIPLELAHPVMTFLVPMAKAEYSSATLSVFLGLPSNFSIWLVMSMVVGAGLGIVWRGFGWTAMIRSATVAVFLWGLLGAGLLWTPRPPNEELLLGDMCANNTMDEQAIGFWRESKLLDEALVRIARLRLKRDDIPAAVRAAGEDATLTGTDSLALEIVGTLAQAGRTEDALKAIPAALAEEAGWKLVRGTLMVRENALGPGATLLAAPEVMGLEEDMKRRYLGALGE